LDKILASYKLVGVVPLTRIFLSMCRLKNTEKFGAILVDQMVVFQPLMVQK